MTGYTIKSLSDDGEFYLVKGWRRNNALFVGKGSLKQEYLYASSTKAEAGVRKLLQECPGDYDSDKFFICYVNGNDITEGYAYGVPDNRPVIPRELLAYCLDCFEDFLDEKGVEIENDEHEGEEGEAILYGSDFDRLMNDLSAVFEGGGFRVPATYGEV